MEDIVVRQYISKKRYGIILFVIVITGGLLRIMGTNWGLPILLHPDEGTIVDTAIRMAINKSFEPDVFFRPDHLLIQINSILYSMVSFAFYGSSVQEVAASHKDIFFLTARIITASFGIGTIFLSYKIGSRIKKQIGLVAAFLFAFLPSFVDHAHYATPDVSTVFFMLLFILVSGYYMEEPSDKNLVLLSVVVGAFITIKYTGAILCICIAIAVILQGTKNKSFKLVLKHGVLSIIIILLTIFLISPVLFLNFGSVQAAFIKEARTTHLGADGLGFMGNLVYYIKVYLQSSGILLVLFWVAGFVYLIKQKKIFVNISLFSSLIYYFCLSYMALHWERWAVPMYVSPLIISAIGIYYIYTLIMQVTNKKRLNILKVIYFAVIGLIGVNFLTGSIAKTVRLMTPDTRVVSKEFTEENNINSSNSVCEGYTTLFPAMPQNITDEFTEVNGVYKINKSYYENILLSSNMFNRYKNEPVRYAVQVAFYESISNDYALIKEYNPVNVKNSIIDIFNIINNIKYIYQLKTTNISGSRLLFYKVNEKNHMEFELGDEILFTGEESNYKNYSMSDFTDPDEWGRVWSLGNEVDFYIYLTNSDGGIDLSFELAPIYGVSQVVEIYANEVLISEVEITEHETYKVKIEQEILFGKKLHITFKIPNAKSPKNLMINSDNRVLGVEFIRIQID